MRVVHSVTADYDWLTSRPFIAKPHEVRAMLDGRMTQFRRPMKPQPEPSWEVWNDGIADEGYAVFNERTGQYTVIPNVHDASGVHDVHVPHVYEHKIRCPFGSPGDVLWVKETWAPYRNRRISEQTYCKQLDHDGDPFVLYRADGTALEYVSTEQGGNCYPRTVSVNIDDTDAGRWHSPVSMPRWASRLTLEIVDVKVERVCEISEDDAIDNGFLPHGNLGAMSARDWLIVHWDLDFPAHPWESSWVWVVTFRRTA